MSKITIKLNGEDMEIDAGSSIENLIETADIKSKMFVVEKNREIIYKPDYATCRLTEGDSVEVVTFFGGG